MRNINIRCITGGNHPLDAHLLFKIFTCREACPFEFTKRAHDGVAPCFSRIVRFDELSVRYQRRYYRTDLFYCFHVSGLFLAVIPCVVGLRFRIQYPLQFERFILDSFSWEAF